MEHITTPVEVLEFSTPDTLRAKNAAFLERYPTDETQIDYYTKLAMQVFDKFQIDGSFTYDGVKTNVEVWWRNKQEQMNLFRKHPYWNEEAKALVFAHNEKREVNRIAAVSALADMIIYVSNKVDESNRYDAIVYAFYRTLDRRKFDGITTVTTEFIESFKDTYEGDLPKEIKRIFKVGTKLTKLVHKAFSQWHKASGEVIDATKLVDDHEPDDRTYRSFDKIYAKFADALSELEIKKITLVSLHFCDFMLMSNGNSWASCHFINSHNIFHEEGTSSYSGCYKQGCLSYALDKPSFLLYTLPATYSGEEYYLEQKINRMCCQYDKGLLITGKCYPNNEDKYITRYRQTLQLILSGLEEVPNLWTFSRNVNRVCGFIETDEDAAHYRDYECENQKPTISICKHFGVDLDHTVTIGHQAYCVDCGTELSSYGAEYLQCSRHRVNRKCSVCGAYIEDEDDIVTIDNRVYCPDCCFYCEVHHRWEPNTDGKNSIEMRHGTIFCCDEAMSDFVKCEKCGKMHYKRQCRESDGKYYCRDCWISKSIENGKIEIIPFDDYYVGDIVLMVDDITVCDYGWNSDMRCYQGRIARITTARSNLYEVTGIDSHNWNWSANCFVGKLVGEGVDDSILGKFIWEI